VSKLTGPYKKHIYWLTQGQTSQLETDLESRGTKLKHAKGIVCTPLDKINKITSVAPEIWDETCCRQGSWYRTSDKNGLYLIVSAFELDGFEARRAAVLCSCCVELFQVLGSEFKNKLVAPCPGATIFARLKPNRYLLVEGCSCQGAENQHVLANSC